MRFVERLRSWFRRPSAQRLAEREAFAIWFVYWQRSESALAPSQTDALRPFLEAAWMASAGLSPDVVPEHAFQQWYESSHSSFQSPWDVPRMLATLRNSWMASRLFQHGQLVLTGDGTHGLPSLFQR